jgi:soluble lytic murein transglycosylase
MLRRGVGLLVIVAIAAVAVISLTPVVKRLVREFNYPLADVAIIRQEAAAEHLDPALVAAVIDAETKFDARTSPAGALGLMQIEPSTAEYLAHLSHGYTFKVADLAEPRVNIAYGCYYLRYLLDQYGHSETLALAAYNAGETNVDRWVTAAKAANQQFTIASIPFPATRAYVEKVEGAVDVYKRDYGL